jgi:Domain of unknown function (DUF4365)
MKGAQDSHGKKANPRARIGQLGINLIEKIVLHDLKCLWTPTQAASDVGIDGYIELCNPDTNEALNLIVQVQSKAIDTQWESETSTSFCFRPTQRDLRHWLGGNCPIVLIASRPTKNEAYWVSLKDYYPRGYNEGPLRIDFDKNKDVFGPQALPALQKLAVAPKTGLYLGPAPVDESLCSNLLPVSRYQNEIHSAETAYRDREGVRGVLKEAGLKNSAKWRRSDD